MVTFPIKAHIFRFSPCIQTGYDTPKWAPSANSPELKGLGCKYGHPLHVDLHCRMCDGIRKIFISGVRKSNRTEAEREI